MMGIVGAAAMFAGVSALTGVGPATDALSTTVDESEKGADTAVGPYVLSLRDYSATNRICPRPDSTLMRRTVSAVSYASLT
jgi:hypothetical protein